MAQTLNGRTFTLLLCLLLGGLAAFLFLFWANPYGPGMFADSLVYTIEARNLSAGNGFAHQGIPITHYPPFYSTVLAAISRPHHDLLQSARWLHASLFAVNIILIGLLSALATGKHLFATLCAVVLALTNTPIFEMHSLLCSEPVFLALVLSALLCLTLHMSTQKYWHLVLSGLLFGIAVITRYIGLTLLPPSILLLWFSGYPSSRKRVRDSLLFMMLALLPLALWILHNVLLTDAVNSRPLVFHPINLQHLIDLVNTLYGFWLPFESSFPTKLAFVILGGLILLIAFVFEIIAYHRQQQFDRAMFLQSFIVLFCIGYILFLMLSISIADAGTPMNYRILLPVHILSIVGIVILCFNMSRLFSVPVLWKALCTIVLLLTSLTIGTTANSALYLRENGFGYSSLSWRTSETLAWLKTLPEDTQIYSNVSGAIDFFTDIPAQGIPVKMSGVTRLTNDRYQDELKTLCRDTVQKGAIVVFFDDIIGSQWHLLGQEELKVSCKPLEFHKLRDGTVYRRRKQ